MRCSLKIKSKKKTNNISNNKKTTCNTRAVALSVQTNPQVPYSLKVSQDDLTLPYS